MSDELPRNRSTDLNLLFGLLALQLDFIKQEALLAAMQAWLFEKTTPLAELLVRHGALNAERRLLLEGLVCEHLKQHADDPQQCLASLSSIESAKQSLGQLADADVQASLAPLLSAPILSLSTTVPRRPASSPLGPAPDVPEDTARFRVLRYHAEGGLGQVWVAEDSELHREVALKVIQPKKAHELSLQSRFVLEGEITGGLEHPGIVPVYGLGHYADGRPFYAMKFIRGDSLKSEILKFHDRFADSQNFDSAAWNLELRKLLQRFLDVCNTIAYAHSRGVLHRDLKPGNVMIGKYGETLVVDWGLAKAVGKRVLDSDNPDETTLLPTSSGSGETVSGSAIGTPAYMPPEQAAGDLAKLGPASDVYSLGATLFHLLTGHPPFEGKAVDILEQVIAGRVVSPRERSPRVPIGLSAICLKSMAHEPIARYASPRDLAQDVERWLADESISARRDNLSTRTRRWVRRHRTLTTSIAVATVIIASLAAGSRYVLNRELARLDRELARLRNEAEVTLSEADGLLAKHDYVRGTNLMHGLLARLEKHAALTDLGFRAQTKLEHLQRFATASQWLQDFRRASEAASGLSTSSDPEKIPTVLTHFEEAFAAMGMWDGDDWKSSDLMTSLPTDLQTVFEAEAQFLTQKYVEYQFRTSSRGSMATGLGFMVSLSRDNSARSARITEILPDSPAAQAGLRTGDRLLEVAGKSTMEFENAAQIGEQLIGKPDTPIELLVKRHQANSPEKITLIRSKKGGIGIGAVVASLWVVGIVENDSTASKAGIRPGDVLMDIDHRPAEGDVLSDGTVSKFFALSMLDDALRKSESSSRHLTLWRPADRTTLEVDLPWEKPNAVRFEWFHHWLLARTLRQEYGAFQFALKNRPESLLKNFGIEDPEQPLPEAIVRGFNRRGWPESVVRKALADVETEFKNAPELREGLDLLVDGKFAPATNALLKYTESHPGDADGWMLLIGTLDGIQRWEAMIEASTNYIARRPLESTGYYNRAVAYRRVGELTLAKRDVQRALELNPGSKEVEAVLKDIEAAEAALKKGKDS